MKRREAITSVGAVVTVGLAGCSGSDGDGSSNGGGSSELAHSGRLRGEDDVLHNIDVESGETIRIEVDNEAGALTLVQVLDPDDETVVDTDVETEDTITHSVEQAGTYQVFVSSDDTTSYEIYLDSG